MSITATASGRNEATAWRRRDQEWTWIALACVGLCALFSLWPELDLHVSRLFLGSAGVFLGRDQALVQGVYQGVPWVGRGLALLALGVALSPRRWWPPRGRRRLLALGLSLLFGVGLLVNGVLKEQWGRARPSEVQALGGTAAFSPALRPVAQCRTNCSFVSGHAATGFALMSVGLLGAPPTRRRWMRVGLAAGLVIGLGRMAQGGHFASDILFAGWVMWACQAALREAWLRRTAWQRRRARGAASPGASWTSHRPPRWPGR